MDPSPLSTFFQLIPSSLPPPWSTLPSLGSPFPSVSLTTFVLCSNYTMRPYALHRHFLTLSVAIKLCCKQGRKMCVCVCAIRMPTRYNHKGKSITTFYFGIKWWLPWVNLWTLFHLHIFTRVTLTHIDFHISQLSRQKHKHKPDTTINHKCSKEETVKHWWSCRSWVRPLMGGQLFVSQSASPIP